MIRLMASMVGSVLLSATAVASEHPIASMEDCKTGAEEFGVPTAGWNFVWENDSIVPEAPTDEEYTQGLQFGYRFRADQQPRWLGTPMSAVCRWIARHSAKGHDKLVGAGSLFIGQHLFTPGDGDAVGLVPDDRPYAAWLYLGTRLEVAQPFKGRFARTGLFHSFELQVGTLGSRANGEWVQNNFHDLIGSDPLLGWRNQLSNEWGVQGFYKVRARVGQWSHRHVDIDATASAQLGLGTVQVLGDVSQVLRLGRNLGDPVADPLGPSYIGNRALASADAAKPEPNGCLDGPGVLAIKECYVFIGVTGRATAFNAFLDGGMIEGGHRVDRDPLNYDWLWGIRVRWSRFQLDYTAIERSREFSPVPAATTSRDGTHKYAAFNVRCFAPIDAKQKRWDLVCPGFFGLLVGLVAAQ